MFKIQIFKVLQKLKIFLTFYILYQILISIFLINKNKIYIKYYFLLIKFIKLYLKYKLLKFNKNKK